MGPTVEDISILYTVYMTQVTYENHPGHNRKKYYIKKVWMPRSGEFGVKIKYANSVAMDLSWIEDTN